MKLDKQQEAAVTTESRRTLVIAGAGSGKTRVLTERIAYLVEAKKVSPYEILAFTFTRKAAGEIRERLENRLERKANHISIGTMHATALSMLHKYGDSIGLKPKQLTIYSEWESSFLLKDVAIEMGIFKKSWKIPKKDIDRVFANYYETGSEPDKDHPAFDLFQAFVQRCRENNALTYGALLTGMKMIIPTIAKFQNWRYVFVDEIQDIDILQWSIINELCKALNAELFVVGDVDQSLYSWRGAVPGYLIEHQHEFKIYRLETNYRSDKNIVEAANALIENNRDRIPKTMVAFEDAQTKIDIIKNIDSAGIVSLIQKLNTKAPDVTRAVLCRIHQPLAKLSALLVEAGIPHNYVGRKSKLTNSEEFRRFLAFLKLMVNPFDNFAFLLIKDILFLSPDWYYEIRMKAAEKGMSHFQVYQQFKENDDFASLYPGHNFEETIRYIESIVKVSNYSFDTKPIVDFIIKSGQSDIPSFLDWLATYDLQDELTEDQEGLQLMTVHGAKGLEFSTIIIAGANEGILPSKQAIRSGNIEDERRIAYVAVTRAEDKLILTVRPEQKILDNGKISESPISRFIGEMDL